VPLKRPYSRTVIYEMHVAALPETLQRVSADKRGTYAGLIEKIPYLQDLGVTAVELLPCFSSIRTMPLWPLQLLGLQSVSFFAPHAAIARKRNRSAAERISRHGKGLAPCGIEVILDVVFNHTSEGDPKGPTFATGALLTTCTTCWRRTAVTSTTRLRQHLKRQSSRGASAHYRQPELLGEEMHVDGFRFDLASILSRDGRATAQEPAHTLGHRIRSGTGRDQADCRGVGRGGLYQVGSFIGDSWKEWNGEFRDDVRSFLKGTMG